MMEETFLYFGYGSNLLRERILIQNPTATFKTIAKLEDQKLVFEFDGEWYWGGSIASISPCPGDHVWGVVWEMLSCDISNLDSQEGVDLGIYQPIEVDVCTPNGEQLKCRSYRLVKKNTDDNRPSVKYLNIIIRGAVQNKLPEDYVQKLKQIEHNGYDGPVEVNIPE